MGRILVVLVAGMTSVGVGLWLGVLEEATLKSQQTIQASESLYDERIPLANPPAFTRSTASMDRVLPSDEAEKVSLDETALTEQPALTLDSGAVASFSVSLSESDARAPELTPGLDPDSPPEEVLEDHDQYLQYEQQQTRKLYKAYVVAAEEKIIRLRGEVQLAAKEGLPQEQLAEGEEKLKRIEAMQRELQQELK